MRGLVVLVAACGADPAPSATVPPQPRAATVVPADAGAVAVPEVPDRPIHAIHGGSIAALSLTEDGGAAVTIDAFGATRLWPTLDGAREPVVVAGVHPAQLAIARTGDRFAVASVDSIGALAILVLRATGAVASRVAISSRPILAVAATPDGFVAQADDQALLRFALDGTPRDRLVPPPGERIASLVARGGRGLALIAGEHGLRGRWLDARGWGEETPALPIEPAHLALSPDGTRIAGRRGKRIAIVALASGRVVDGFPVTDDPDASALAFIDPTHLATVVAHRLRFWHAGADVDAGEVSGEAAAADGAVVWARGATLVIVRPRGTAYLGYRLAEPHDVRALEHGFVLGDGAALVRTDEHFAQRVQYELAGMWNYLPLDAHHTFAMARSGGDGDLVAVDLDTGTQLTLARDVMSQIAYQPATHLYAALARGRVMVGRYDPKTRTFEGPIAIPLANAGDMTYVYPWFELPERGSLVSIVEPIGQGRATRTDIGAIDFATGAVAISGLGTRMLADEQAQVDPPPTAHGRLVAALRAGRIELREAGAVRWIVASHGIAQLLWTPGGELVGVGTGLARFDLASGAFAERRCGWSFGLATEAPETFATSEGTLCDD